MALITDMDQPLARAAGNAVEVAAALTVLRNEPGEEALRDLSLALAAECLATGGIAESFARDLWPNPETRGVNDIEHKVVAAASSSSAKRAEDFLKEVRAPEGAKAYGSYKELVEDPNVDIIYVATPHSHHYQNARLCLEAGKNVLCEKAFTTNAKQLEELIKIAKEKNVFLMEAVCLSIPVLK